MAGGTGQQAPVLGGLRSRVGYRGDGSLVGAGGAGRGKGPGAQVACCTGVTKGTSGQSGGDKVRSRQVRWDVLASEAIALRHAGGSRGVQWDCGGPLSCLLHLWSVPA